MLTSARRLPTDARPAAGKSPAVPTHPFLPRSAVAKAPQSRGLAPRGIALFFRSQFRKSVNPITLFSIRFGQRSFKYATMSSTSLSVRLMRPPRDREPTGSCSSVKLKNR